MILSTPDPYPEEYWRLWNFTESHVTFSGYLYPNEPFFYDFFDILKECMSEGRQKFMKKIRPQEFTLILENVPFLLAWYQKSLDEV